MKRLSGWKIMTRLIGELQALIPVMMSTIFLGVLGFLAAIFISGFAVIALGTFTGEITTIRFETAITVMIVLAIMRGFLRYGEQLSGHYLAFKILMQLRDKVFAHLRKLAPAKLETKAKGQLIAIVTSDIEMLEVFYAHTIAPIAIAIITSSIIVAVLAQIHAIFAFIAAIFFLLVGVAMPLYSSKAAGKAGVAYREVFSNGNNFLLDSLRGLKEIVAFGQQAARSEAIKQHSVCLNEQVKHLKQDEAITSGMSDILISLAIIIATLTGVMLYVQGTLSFVTMIFAVVIIASSFGPVVALSRLANTLGHTFACAQRLFDLLDEQPQVVEIDGQQPMTIERMTLENVAFQYEDVPVLKQVNMTIEAGEKVAIIGPSGSGKSTLMKLLLRYFDPQVGGIKMNNQPLHLLPTSTIRTFESVMSQETFLFADTIRANLLIAKPSATQVELESATKKAAIHDFIVQLPNGYDSQVGELGSLLSSGERQRLGLARLFLHDGQVWLLDEPTSNLDALNEATILQSLSINAEEKTVIFISHRQSTTAIADSVYSIEHGVMKQKETDV
ncbi:MAG: thiol reductant ABC exporter subunit CydC [Culicoidibacterales bacterium]